QRTKVLTLFLFNPKFSLHLRFFQDTGHIQPSRGIRRFAYIASGKKQDGTRIFLEHIGGIDCSLRHLLHHPDQSHELISLALLEATGGVSLPSAW
ncbi:hypothetical protein Hamer_G019543, partial [Homarus americanus]